MVIANKKLYLHSEQDKNHMYDSAYVNSKHRYTYIYDIYYPNKTNVGETAVYSVVFNVSGIHITFLLVIMPKLNYLVINYTCH